jgi:hypothetical protein
MGVLKAIFVFAVLGLVVFALFQVTPPVMKNYSFQDDLKNVAMIDGPNTNKSDDDVRTDVLRKAKALDLALEPNQVTVQRINTPGIAAVYVAADYSVPINLPGYSFDLHFTPDSGNKGF